MGALHTPGPWVAFPYTEPANTADGLRMGWHINQTGGPGYVTTLHCASHRAAEDFANARLIAAAPGLLAALQGLIARHNDGSAEAHWAEWDTAAEAIAKATGAAP